VFFEGAPALVERPKKRFRLDTRPTLFDCSLNNETLSGDTLIEFRDQPVSLHKMFPFLVAVFVPGVVGKHIIHSPESYSVSGTNQHWRCTIIPKTRSFSTAQRQLHC
jgi:hypothetical protein